MLIFLKIYLFCCFSISIKRTFSAVALSYSKNLICLKGPKSYYLVWGFIWSIFPLKTSKWGKINWMMIDRRQVIKNARFKPSGSLIGPAKMVFFPGKLPHFREFCAKLEITSLSPYFRNREKPLHAQIFTFYSSFKKKINKNAKPYLPKFLLFTAFFSNYFFEKSMKRSNTALPVPISGSSRPKTVQPYPLPSQG